MSDVPAWAFALTTVVTATVALVPVFVEPAKDRRAREASEKAQLKQLRLAKVEGLFLEIEKSASYLDNALVSETDRIFGPHDNGLIESAIFSVPLPIFAIITTHFPEAIPLVDECREETVKEIGRYRKQLPTISAESSKTIRSNHTMAMIQLTSVFLAQVRLHLYERARKYVDADSAG